MVLEEESYNFNWRKLGSFGAEVTFDPGLGK
jgi:hypothetical protein